MWQIFLNFNGSFLIAMTTLASVVEHAVELQTFVMVGQDELRMRGLLKQGTKPNDIDKINDAIRDYVEKRMELESNRSSVQWDLVTAAQNTVTEAVQCLHSVRVVEGHVLWDAPPPKVVQIQTPSASTDIQIVQNTEPGMGKRSSTGSTPTGSMKNGQSTRSKAVRRQTTTSMAASHTLGIGTCASTPKPPPKPQELPGVLSNAVPLRFGPPKVRKKANEDDLWKKFSLNATPSEQPSVEWLTQLRDLVVDLGPANKDKVISKIGLELWCQLVFLNVHRGNSRTLSKTKVSKVDISTWDLIPTEANMPCKTCSHKVACHWPNSEDHSKCRECHLQAKRCTFSGNSMKRGRKRKRSSESPSTSRRRVKVDLEADEDDEVDSQDEMLDPPAEALNTLTRPRPTLTLQKMDSPKTPATRSSTSKLLYPTKVTPHQNLGSAERIAQLTPRTTLSPRPSSSSLNPEMPTPFSEIQQTRSDKSPPVTMPPVPLNERGDDTTIGNESIITCPMLSVPASRSLTIHDSRSPTPTADDPSKNTFPTLANEFFHSGKTNMSPTRPHGRPDHDEYGRLLEEIKDWDADTCKRHLARVMADLHCAIGNTRELQKQLNELLKKDEALLAFVLEIDAAHQKALKELTQLRSNSQS
ncbi:uncharacterized protein EV420DRAFT_1557957 [Desarmillaria tabescens]|uniref:Zn(2)-C6 fungal-type domain-containing protein n=1 Tax=Armillaria tabescens TaxID=1929756 RepID=A0AA39K3Y9_ARMTA|nr:uncharacterized protein EV420DRAFT_1557957 [Desarmillaria tabescens]KAK0453000.1 hypothetical protein EV420DRAFT_1557957 [Desarmillaria tabescens]